MQVSKLRTLAAGRKIDPLSAGYEPDKVIEGETMRRREFIALVGASCTWPFAALAQEPGRMYRVGSLQPFPRDTPANLRSDEMFRRSGFIEGQNFTIEYRDYGLHPDLISQYAAELVKAQCDVIIAGGGAGVRAVQQATKTIPIVGLSDDMVGEGLADSLVRPVEAVPGFAGWRPLPIFAGQEACQSGDRTADKVRAGDQPEDR
jgi:hypothetical protein